MRKMVSVCPSVRPVTSFQTINTIVCVAHTYIHSTYVRARQNSDAQPCTISTENFTILEPKNPTIREFDEAKNDEI